MQFLYYQYLMTSLVFPLFMIGIALLGIVPELFQMNYAILHNQTYRSMHLARTLTMLLISGIFFCIGTSRLMYGGIHLIYERESDAVVVQGQIELIEELNILAFPSLDCKYTDGNTHGIQITINGIHYTAIEKGTLEIGDSVVIKYLPQSRYVLHIEKIDLHCITSNVFIGE